MPLQSLQVVACPLWAYSRWNEKEMVRWRERRKKSRGITTGLALL